MMCAARLHSRILLPERLQERPRRIAKFPVPVDACTVRQSQRGHSVRRKYQVRAFALAEFLRKAPPFFLNFSCVPSEPVLVKRSFSFLA
jgi:hypothetical protein